MRKKYKIKLPKGKKVTMTNVDFEDGVMTVNVELENERTFGRIATEKLGKAANKRIKEHDKQIDKILKMADDKDVRAVANMILQEYGENICRKKQPKCPRTLSEPKLIDEIYESISKRAKEPRELCDIKQKKYEPKDGDFVYVKAGYEHIAIFKNIKENDLYAYVECNNVTTNFVCANLAMPICHIKDIKEIRPATEEEKKSLIDKLSEKGKRWNADTKQIEDVRWRAKKNEPYYYIVGFYNIIGTTDEQMACDDNRYCTNNYFKTREAAEKASAQIREVFKKSKAE